MGAAGLLISIGQRYCPIACSSRSSGGSLTQVGQKVGPVRRDTSRDGLDRVDPRPATTVDSFDPLVVRPDPREQVCEFAGERR